MAAVGARAEAGVEYLEAYRRWLKKFALLVSPEDQLPVRLAGYNVTECELPGEVLLWTHQYLSERHCPSSLLTPLCRIILDEVSKAVKKNPNDFGFDPIEAVYISLRLMQAVIARVNAICLRYLDNSQLDTLPPPPTAREYKISSIALKNTRRMMEDRHVVFSNLESVFGIETTEPTSFYAVYDGHGGSAAAAYCCAHLHQYLVESPHFRTDPQRALRDAFLRTDHEFMKKSHEKRANGGSTAVVVLVRGKTLYAGWVGDSQALLAKRLGLMQLVTPHKPSRQDERDRIMAEGGSVLFCWGNWRVNGQLDVSRAIGDTMYKPYVSGEPDLTTVDLDGDEDFVVLACDGLFDFVMDDDITLLVYGDLISNPDDYKAVVKKLVLRAVEEGSEDNISVIVVFLKEPRDIAADNAAQMEATESNIRLDSATILPRMDSDGHTIDLAEPVKIDPTIERILNMEHDDDNMGEDDGVDSDSEDLGPETAVDVADDVDIEIQRQQARDREPPCEPRRETPTPPAHAVCPAPPVPGEGENVAESGEESEDEWNYFKGEEKTEKRSPTPREGDLDAQELDTRRPEPGPDHDSAWDSSSGDMNSSPLNPDAPVFIPGGAESPLGGPLLSDDVIAESPRKPVPMDDIELPDSAQFANEATARPAELLDLDNYDQINGHHNVSLEEKTEQLNGNSHHEFGFGLDSGKLQDSLLQDIERVQKDTTDFCNIQVTYAHTGDVDPVSGDIDEELFERLKNKERDPMSMSFYQEKDDDTSDIAGKPQPVDLNAVQPLPDSDEENDTPPNEQNRFGDDKENIFNDHYNDNYTPEPDNDLLAQENPHILEFNAQNLQDNGPIIQANIIETDTPESHKLLFEQIPELPDGKSSDIDFISKDIDDSSERDMDVSSGVHTEERTPSETEGELQEFAASPQPTTDHPLADLVQTEPAETVPDVFDNSKPQELIFGFTNEANSFNLERKDDFFAETQFESDNKSESNENPFLSGSSEKEEASVENLQAFIQESVLNSQSPFPSNHSDLSQHDLDPQIEEHKSEELHNDFESNNFKLPHEESLEEPKVLSEPVVEVEISALEQKFEEQLVLNEFEAPSNPDDFSTVNDILQNCDTQIHLEGDKTDMEPPQEQFTLEESLAAHPTPTPEPTLNLEETEAPMQEPAPIQKVEEPTALEVVAPVSFTPTPEILVPEVTPILATVTPEPEVEIKESRAQEICLPVTSEILPAGEDLNIDLHKEEPTTQPPAIATPPPTPAVEPTAPPLDTLFTSAEPIIPVQETLIAADIPAPPESQVEPEIPALALAGVVTGAAVVAAAATATAAKSKTPASTKKAPATSPTKAATKTLTSKTMTPAPKKTTDKPTTPKTPVSATKGTASATKTAVSKLASTSKTPTTKPAPLSTKPSPASAKTTPTVPARSAPASKPPVSKPPVTKSAPAAPRPTSTKTSTVAPRAASASTTARPAPARTSTTKPTTVAAPKPKPAPAPKADPKPLTNGDVRPPIRRPIPGAVAAPKPAVTAAAPKPAPRPAPTARPAPRPTTARPATTAHTNGATQAKAAAPKPATRAPISGARPALEKQTKDLSNKRLVAKTAPSRTSTVTTKGSANPTAVKIPSKIQAEKALAASAEQAKLAGEAPLTNGAGDAAELPAKAPATPPPQDNALLPDLVA